MPFLKHIQVKSECIFTFFLILSETFRNINDNEALYHYEYEDNDSNISSSTAVTVITITEMTKMMMMVLLFKMMWL